MSRFLRYYFLRFIRLQGHPTLIARGVGIGLFIGMTPTIPLHTILLLTLCIPFKASKIAAFLSACLISNPLTLFPQYYGCWYIGSVFFPELLSWEKIRTVLELLSHAHGYIGFKHSMIALSQLGLEAASVMITGGLVLAFPLAVVGYYSSLTFFTKLRNKRYRHQYESCSD